MKQIVVAIVDDEPSVLKGLGRLLRTCGVNAETYNSGEAFLERETATELACVVLDIHLGGISGIETRRRLAERASTIPVIYMTAVDTEAVRKQAMASGCAAFLLKPFTADQLIDSVRKATSPFDGRLNKMASV